MLAAVLGSHAADLAPGLGASADAPRAFGYVVGDVVTRRISLQVPPGLQLDEDSLPRAGAKGRALELQRVQLRKSLFGTPRSVRLDYQIFLAPTALRVLEMPPIELRFTGSSGAQTVRIDAWPVSVGPLTPAEAATREGLGEMRPDRAPLPVETRAARTRLAVEAGAMLLLLGYLASVYLVLPWSAQRNRPFARAWKQLKALPAAPDAAAHRAAFGQVHAALNAAAGEVLFAPGIDPFLVRQPRFASLRGDLVRFFAASRAAFFRAGDSPVDGAWLVDFCRRCRDLERGAA